MKSQTRRIILNEIGDTNKGYPFTLQMRGSGAEAKFKADTGLEYIISFDIYVMKNYTPWYDSKKSYEEWWSLNINFGVDYHSTGKFSSDNDWMEVTNKGVKEAFKVMATVLSATRTYILRLDKKGIRINDIEFSASDTGKGKGSYKAASQRMKLYLAFIKKNMKHLEIIDTSADGAEIRVKDSFYK